MQILSEVILVDANQDTQGMVATAQVSDENIFENFDQFSRQLNISFSFIRKKEIFAILQYS